MPSPTNPPDNSALFEESVGIHPAALVAAICLPGLGHIVRGEKARGFLAMFGILGMFFSGMLIGGLDAVDRRTEFWWFVPQAGIGPVAFAVDYVKRDRFLVVDTDRTTGRPVYRPAGPKEGRNPATGGPIVLPTGQSPPYIRSLGKSYEIGILYCALAGMTNLIIIIDAGFPTRRPAAKKPAATPTPPAGAPA